MKRLHMAIATHQIAETVKDYSSRFGVEPCVYVSGEFALWRTDSFNVSIRHDPSCQSGELRHLGWEDPTAHEFSENTDVNGIVWERFTAQQQAHEINALWPEANFSPK